MWRRDSAYVTELCKQLYDLVEIRVFQSALFTDSFYFTLCRLMLQHQRTDFLKYMRTWTLQRTLSFVAQHNYPIAHTHLFICQAALKENILSWDRGWPLFSVAEMAATLRRAFHSSVSFWVFWGKNSTFFPVVFVTFTRAHTHTHTSKLPAPPTPPLPTSTNSLTLIVFISPWKCPQISDLSKLFCLHNPLCTTWPCSIPTALSSSLEENNADSNNAFSLH